MSLSKSKAVRPDYADTEWRVAKTYSFEYDNGPPWWGALISAIVMLMIPVMLVWCIVA